MQFLSLNLLIVPQIKKRLLGIMKNGFEHLQKIKDFFPSYQLGISFNHDTYSTMVQSNQL